MILVDSNVVIDLIEPRSAWHEWSSAQVSDRIDRGLFINTIVVAEIGGRFGALEELADALAQISMPVIDLSVRACWLAGRAYLQWVRNGGRRGAILPDLLIGAHAVAESAAVLTRDPRRFRTCFPDLELITPEPDHD